MAEVVHTIKGNQYLYEHKREGDKVVCKYIGPVGGTSGNSSSGSSGVTQQNPIKKSDTSNNKVTQQSFNSFSRSPLLKGRE